MLSPRMAAFAQRCMQAVQSEEVHLPKLLCCRWCEILPIFRGGVQLAGVDEGGDLLAAPVEHAVGGHAFQGQQKSAGALGIKAEPDEVFQSPFGQGSAMKGGMRIAMMAVQRLLGAVGIKTVLCTKPVQTLRRFGLGDAVRTGAAHDGGLDGKAVGRGKAEMAVGLRLFQGFQKGVERGFVVAVDIAEIDAAFGADGRGGRQLGVEFADLGDGEFVLVVQVIGMKVARDQMAGLALPAGTTLLRIEAEQGGEVVPGEMVGIVALGIQK